MISSKSEGIIDPKELKRKLELPQVKVSLGCGLHWKQPFEEWINHDGLLNDHTDIVSEFSSIPLPDKCADHVEMGDIVEHIPKWRQDETWAEWNRIMKIGCTIRVSTPNLHRACVEYAEGTVTLENLIQQIYAWQTGPYEQHYITYTQETLTALLNKYGYDNVDFWETPGVLESNPDKGRGWWLVCSAVKVRDI